MLFLVILLVIILVLIIWFWMKNKKSKPIDNNITIPSIPYPFTFQPSISLLNNEILVTSPETTTSADTWDDPIMVSLFFNVNNNDTRSVILGNYSDMDYTYNFLNFEKKDGRLRMYLRQSDSLALDWLTNTKIEQNKWYNLFVIFSNNNNTLTISYYISGEYIEKKDTQLFFFNRQYINMLFGKDHRNIPFKNQGIMVSKLNVFDQIASEDEIKQFYEFQKNDLNINRREMLYY